MSPLERTAQTFLDAAAMFQSLVASSFPQDRAPEQQRLVLDRPALGDWTVRDLIGHTLRAVLTVESALGKPAVSTAQHTPGGYYHAGRALVGRDEVAARGRQAGAELGDDVSSAVVEALARVAARTQAEVDAGGDPVVTTVVGGMRLSSYLATRTVELVLHTIDLARALGVRPDVPVDAMNQTLEVLAELALLDGRGCDVASALTGRTPLPEGLSLVG